MGRNVKTEPTRRRGPPRGGAPAGGRGVRRRVKRVSAPRRRRTPSVARRKRCAWATREPLLSYHDVEWGTPVHDDRLLFEFLILEGMQAGLSWETVLRKRDAFRHAFVGFDPVIVARFTSKDVTRLMNDESIIRNRAKIDAAIGNAKALGVVQKEFASFDRYVWGFDDKDALSKDLKKRGFRFVGPTIVESFMQAVGIRNDHERGCYRRAELTRARATSPAR
ncbi:MAG: DNA-3-methyladenine glycosylase I [Chloroflexi bacterium]|nr:MAG: DNA-3-methyladenine glycosylase I [Chloroflexota bacterium]